MSWVQTKGWIKFAIMLGVVVVAVLSMRSSVTSDVVSPQNLRELLLGFGSLAPVVYMLIYVVLTVSFFPAAILSAAGGFVFGAFLGTVYTIIAATVAAVIAFLLGRTLGRDFVQKRLGGKLKQFEQRISGTGFWSMVILRLLFLPYIPLSYVAGLTNISLWDFTVATFLTDIPGSFAFTYLGASITEPKNLMIAILIIGLVLCIPLVIKRWQTRNMSTKK